ncbi:unnamed protein product [Rhizopus microsporus]
MRSKKSKSNNNEDTNVRNNQSNALNFIKNRLFQSNNYQKSLERQSLSLTTQPLVIPQQQQQQQQQQQDKPLSRSFDEQSIQI